MKDKILDNIKNFAKEELRDQFGFCGCADSDNMAILNSTNSKGQDIIIKIEAKQDE